MATVEWRYPVDQQMHMRTTETIGSSWNTSQSKTETETRGQTRGYQIGGGIAETFHKKPLLETHEINSYLRAIADSECDDPAYPGLMLVRISGEDPFFVRRSNYDQDPYFEHCFSQDPLHGFVPLSQQPLLGYQYTPHHIGELRIPEILRDDGGIPIIIDMRALQRFETGTRLCFVPDENAFEEHGEIKPDIEVRAACRGRVLELTDTVRDEVSEGRFLDFADPEDGVIMTIKTEEAYSDQARRTFENSVFAKYIDEIHQNEEEARRLEEERQARLAREAEERRLEIEREAALLAQERAARIAAVKQALPKAAAAIIVVALVGYWAFWPEPVRWNTYSTEDVTDATHEWRKNAADLNDKNDEISYNDHVYPSHCFNNYCFVNVDDPLVKTDKSGYYKKTNTIIYSKYGDGSIKWSMMLSHPDRFVFAGNISYSEKRNEISLVLWSETKENRINALYLFSHNGEIKKRYTSTITTINECAYNYSDELMCLLLYQRHWLSTRISPIPPSD